MKAVVGIDYGTQSARAIMVDAATGEVLRQHAVAYSHGILPGDLADVRDYEEALDQLLQVMGQPPYGKSIACVGVDGTSLTLVPTDASGCALGKLPEWEGNTHAQVKLWKRHTAQAQAEEALELAQRTGQPFLRRLGGNISSEWMLPKLMEIYDEAPDIWNSMDLAFDVCDYLTYLLTGVVTRGWPSLSFKCLWSDDKGFPQASYLDTLRPGLSERYRHLQRGKVIAPGSPAGVMRPELCRRYGMPEGVVVAAGLVDGHTSAVALGAVEAGDVALVIGTSNVLTLQTKGLHEMDGICGVVKDGFVPGLYGIETGQACTGDMLDWFVHNALAGDVALEAQKEGISPHAVLCRRIDAPWSSRLAAVDWLNGSRTFPCDLSLTGAFAGLTLRSRPEDLYLAMLQGIVCGTREILDQLAAHGAESKRVFAAGGITQKNPLLMQMYADILEKEIHVGRSAEGPALGTAVYAAVAAGLYPSLKEAHEHMGIRDFVTYAPDAVHRAEYRRVYKKNHRLRQLLIEFEHA